MKPFPALKRPYFVTFLLRPNAALDNQTFHAEPQSLLSRRDDTCERMSSLRGLRPYEERARVVGRWRQPRRGERRESCIGGDSLGEAEFFITPV